MTEVPSFPSNTVRPYKRMTLPNGYVNLTVQDDAGDLFSYNYVNRVFVKQTTEGVRWTLSRTGEEPVVIDPEQIRIWDDAEVLIVTPDSIEGEFGHLFPGGFSL